MIHELICAFIEAVYARQIVRMYADENRIERVEWTGQPYMISMYWSEL